MRSNRLFLGDDLHRHIGGDVRHQTNGDDVFAGRLDGAERRANLRLLDLEAELVHRFSDVGVGDGAEQAAVDAALAGDRNFSAVELAGEFFGGSDASSLSLFEFSAASFELGDSLLRGALGVTLGDQEVAAVAVLDLDDVAQIAEMRDLFKQNDLHFSFLPSITGCPYRAGGPGSGHA